MGTVVRLLQLQVNENMTCPSMIRVGNKGSLAIAKQRTSQRLKGVWFNFETEESGDMVDLVRTVKKLSSDQVNFFNFSFTIDDKTFLASGSGVISSEEHLTSSETLDTGGMPGAGQRQQAEG